MTAPIDRGAVRAVLWKDITAVKRSKAVVLPMLLLPAVMLLGLPIAVGIIASGSAPMDISNLLRGVPANLAAPITSLPPRQQPVVLVLGYLIAPLFLIIPLMVSAVLAADAFAGEKERRTIETLLHLPISNRDLYLAKLLSAFLPAVAVSWIGFACYLVVGNAAAWPVMHRMFLPTKLWAAVIIWLSPAVAAFGLGIMVRVSARARTAQEANQLGGTVILPLVLAIVAQTSVLLLADLWVTLVAGAVVWVVAIALNVRGASRFARDTLATKL